MRNDIMSLIAANFAEAGEEIRVYLETMSEILGNGKEHPYEFLINASLIEAMNRDILKDKEIEVMCRKIIDVFVHDVFNAIDRPKERKMNNLSIDNFVLNHFISS